MPNTLKEQTTTKLTATFKISFFLVVVFCRKQIIAE